MKFLKLKSISSFTHKLKPFFDFRIEKFEDVISMVLGISVFVIIVFQAYFIDITYDEAYTYLNTGRIQDVWKIYLFRIANTHVLNSLLMTITTLFFPYYDFALRLPSVMISGLYIITAIAISKKYQNGLMVLGMLLLFYYVIEYMALARGYGMSATFMLAAFFVYKNKVQFKDFYIWITYLFILAVYSSYVAIVPFGIMMVFLFVKEFKFKIPEVSKLNLRWIIGLSVLALYGFYSVTKAGKPLYGAYTQTFFEAVPQDTLVRFLGGGTISLNGVTIGTLILVGVIGVIGIFSRGKNTVGIVTLVSFVAIFTVSWVGGKPLPTGRILVPYWPLFVLSIMEVFEFVTKKIRVPFILLRVVNVLVLGVLVLNFQSQLNLTKYVRSKSVQWKIPINIMAGYGKEIFPHDTYYLEKDWKHDILKAKLDKMTPNETSQLESVTIRQYADLRLITVNFDVVVPQNIYRQVWENQQVIYSDTIDLTSDIYNFEDNRPMLIPFPRMGGDELVITNGLNGWEKKFAIPLEMETFFPLERHHSM